MGISLEYDGNMFMVTFWLVEYDVSFHFIYGMSSETHWRTPSFFKMVKTTN